LGDDSLDKFVGKQVEIKLKNQEVRERVRTEKIV
jgi:small nuclear ribonucleoprotein (snRNP)-like protein